MTQVAIAAIGAVALLVPALLSIPFGPRRRVAVMHEKIRALADLEAAPGEDSLSLGVLLRQEIHGDIHRLELQRTYGSPAVYILIMLSGTGMFLVGIFLGTGDQDPDETLAALTRFALYLMIVWGLLITIGATSQYAYSVKRMLADRKVLKTKVAGLAQEEQRKTERMRVVEARRDRVEALRVEVADLEAELLLYEAEQARDEMVEKVEALRDRMGAAGADEQP